MGCSRWYANGAESSACSPTPRLSKVANALRSSGVAKRYGGDRVIEAGDERLTARPAVAETATPRPSPRDASGRLQPNTAGSSTSPDKPATPPRRLPSF